MASRTVFVNIAGVPSHNRLALHFEPSFSVTSYDITWIKALDRAIRQRPRAEAAGIESGRLWRSINHGGRLWGHGLTEKVIWQVVEQYAADAALPSIAPHDLRRTSAKLCRAGGGELEQIQILLGHASVQTTERYLGTRQNLTDAPNDHTGLGLGE